MVNYTIVTDSTIRQPGFDLPRQSWSLLNRFQTGQDPCCAIMGPFQITDIRLWPSADYEPYRGRVSIDKVRWRTTTTSRSWRWHSQVAGVYHGLSHRYDWFHHYECDLLWAKSPIRERHIRWQIWHSKLLVDGGPDLHRSRLASNSWMCRTSNSSTADLHVERQPVLSIASVSSLEGVLLHWVNVLFRQSLYLLYCPPGRRKPWWSCP